MPLDEVLSSGLVSGVTSNAVGLRTPHPLRLSDSPIFWYPFRAWVDGRHKGSAP